MMRVAVLFSWALASPVLGDFIWGHVEDLSEGASAGQWATGARGTGEEAPHTRVAEGAGEEWGGRKGKGPEELIRQARSLVYPGGGVYKFIIGMGIPIPVPNKTLALGVNFQFQYGVPTNASQYAYPVIIRARNARYHRAALYNSIESALDRKGLSGRACLLRAVCEAAETPLLHDGLLGELFHLLLTPSLGHAPPDLLWEYRAAEEAGAAGEDCARKFSDCPPGSGLLDHVTCLRPLADHEKDDDWRTPPPHWDFLAPKDARN